MTQALERITRAPGADVFTSDATAHEMQVAIDNSMTGISWLTAEGIFSQVREGYASMLGYSPEEMQGLSWQVTVPEADHEKAIAAVMAMLEHGRADVELRATRKDGSEFYKQLLLVKTVDGDGNHNGHYCFMRDITARKRAEDALRRSREFSDRLLDVIHDGVCVVDETGRYIKVNEAFLKMTGFAESELIGSLPPYPHWPEEHVDHLLQHLDVHRTAQQQLMFRRKNGQRFPVIVNPSSTFDNDGKRIFIATIKDISEREEAARRMAEVERLQALGTFAGGIAHDLNNLLTPVLCYADALTSGLFDRDEAAGAIRGAAERAHELIDRMLRFTHPQPDEPGRISVSKATRDALQFMRTSLPTNVSLQTSFEADRDVVACAEATLLQVVMNLAVNAGYAMRDGGGQLRVRVHNPAPDTVELVVSDTGPGIPQQHVNRIFEPFYTTKPVGEGTGLGLTTVRNAVLAARGTIDVESPSGGGARFTVRLPLADGRAATADRVDRGLAAKSAGEETTRALRVMLIDDQDDVLDVASALFGKLGHEVSSFTDPREALRSAPDSFDLIVTDYRMDGMTGLDFLRQAGDLDVPVILMTGDRGPEDKLPRGVAHFLRKPFTFDAIRRAVDAVYPPRSL